MTTAIQGEEREKKLFPTLIVVSDSTGETADHMMRAAMIQFDVSFSRILYFRHVEDEEKIEKAMAAATEAPSVLVCTLVDQKVRDSLAASCASRGVPFVDLLGPLLSVLESSFGVSALRAPGLLRKLDDEYFRKIRAIEFAIQCDDGKRSALLHEADLIILGVSRTGKTPLSMYMANKGYKTANVPLIPEVDPPDILRFLPSSKMVGLSISAERLMQIRQERLRLLGLKPHVSSYGYRERVERELRFGRDCFKQLGIVVYDVTDKAVEETAQEILDSLRGR